MHAISTDCGRLRAHTRGTHAGNWQRLRKLFRILGKTEAETDDERIPLTTILEHNGLDYALWCLRAAVDVERHTPAMRLYAVWCTQQVPRLLTDPRSLDALRTAERHAKGEATDAELAAAWDTAWRAARDAQTAVSAAPRNMLYAAKAAAAVAARDATQGDIAYAVDAVARASRGAVTDFGLYLVRASPRSRVAIEGLAAAERVLGEQAEAFRRRFG